MISLSQYYRHFKKVQGVITVVLSASPFLSFFVPDGYSGYLFPPISPTLNVVLKFVTILLLFVTTLYAWSYGQSFSSPESSNSVLHRLLVGSLLSLGLYLVVFMGYTHSLSFKDGKITKTDFVSVGFKRGSLGRSDHYKNISDLEALKKYGSDEEDIFSLWMPFSVITVRIILYLSYLGFLAFLVLFFSLNVLFDLRHLSHRNATTLTDP